MRQFQLHSQIDLELVKQNPQITRNAYERIYDMIMGYGREEYIDAKKKLVHANREKMIYPANAWGIYDMHGNVFEWCQDYYASYPDQATDPSGPIRGKERVRRGGSFLRSAHQSRSAARHSVEPSWRGSETGFRLVIGFPL